MTGAWESGDTMSGTKQTATRTIAGLLVAGTLAVGGVLAIGAPAANAAYGDLYGAAPINDGPGPAEEAPGIPGTRAFWAGACDRGAATGVFGSLVSRGGVGVRPTQILAPGAGTTATHTLVDAPATPAHCLDWGTMTSYKDSLRIWPLGESPKWRLPAVTQAGAHPDGTSMLAWRRGATVAGAAPGSAIDGSVDNVVVDLPPGFVGNPQAVPVCSAVEFRAKPLRCPAQSQVGVLSLYIEGVPFGGANVGAYGYDTTYPVFNLEPRPGRAAELGFGYASGEQAVTVRLTGRARTNGDYGISAFVGQIPAALSPLVQSITLWGVPWAAENDSWRAKLGHFENTACNKQPGPPPVASAKQYIPPGGLQVLADQDCRARYQPSWGEIKPFLTSETDCNTAPSVRLATDAFQHPGPLTADGDPAIAEYPWPLPGAPLDESGPWKTYTSTSPAVTGCTTLGFGPDIAFAPTSDQADGASGLRVDLAVAQNNEPPPGVAHDPGSPTDIAAGAPGHWRSAAGRATAHLKDTVVRLPVGVSVNPSGATGLAGCSDVQIGVRGFDGANGRLLFNDGDPFNKDGGADGAECPDASKIGTASVVTPLLAEPVVGEVVVGGPQPADIGGPGDALTVRLYIVVRDRERGLVVKIFGRSVTDPASGEITTTFANNPELPFDKLSLDIQGGARGMLALPARCGTPGWSSSFSAWSGSPAVVDSGGFGASTRCGFGFSPQLVGGMTPRVARSSGRFDFKVTRPEGDQTVQGLTAKLPQGLLASVRGVPLCSAGEAAGGSCPAGSRIGWVDGAAGSGTPFVLERKGDVYLTEGYKGAPYGLMVRVPVEAGPFRGPLALAPIVVRAAVHVDRRTAEVTTVSDPLPQIWHGVPLRVREITAVIDRQGFMQNPSDCSAKQIGADLSSPQGATAFPTAGFQAANCARLGFKPKLRLRLTGRRQTRTGKHPGVRAQVTQTVGEAGIKRAEVRLPRSLALDVDNAQALCEFADGTKPDLENHCPKGSIVGRVRASSPLLNRPLVGNVYFVKNVRTDPDTGNTIRTLPMIIAALRGEIAVNLHGESSVDSRNRLVSTFSTIPDAPVSKFNLNIKGGRNGILAVTRTRRSKINICNSRQTAKSQMDAYNGRAHNRNIRIKTPCRKTKKTVCRTKAQKRRKACKQKTAKRQQAKRITKQRKR